MARQGLMGQGSVGSVRVGFAPVRALRSRSGYGRVLWGGESNGLHRSALVRRDVLICGVVGSCPVGRGLVRSALVSNGPVGYGMAGLGPVIRAKVGLGGLRSAGPWYVMVWMSGLVLRPRPF